MPTASTSLCVATSDPKPTIRTNVWETDGTVGPARTQATVTFGVPGGEIILNATAEMLDQLLRDALNALGEAVDAHDEQYGAKTEAVPA